MAESGTLRWIAPLEARPWGPFWMGVLLTAVLSAVMLAWWAVNGLWSTLFDPEQAFGLSRDGRSHLVLNVLLAFVVVCAGWARRRAIEELPALHSESRLSAGEIEEIARSGYERPPGFALLIIPAAVMVGAFMIPATSSDIRGFLRPSTWDLHLVWALGVNVAIFAAMFDSAHRIRRQRRVLERITDSIPRVDLLDRSRLAPFGRIGLRGAFVWVGASSIASTLTWGAERVGPLFAVLSLTLVFATLSFLRPAALVHRRLRDAKRAELERVRRRVEDAKESALSADVPGAALLPGLLAYEARIEAVNEWPFDTPTLFRFGALAVIASGSWLGGAVVERMLGAVLD